MKPVLIVGAGPVGLTTALSLAHQGIPVQVIEAEPALTLDQRAGSFHPPTLEMLAPFGVTEAMHEVGIKVPHWQIRDRREGVIVEWDLGVIADLTPYPYRFHLEQHRLTPILYEKLKAFPHAEVRFSTGFIDAKQSGDTVTVSTTSGELKTPWLVGCDGGRSTVRKHLGTPFDGFTWPERFIVISTLADFAQHGFTSNAYVADPREWAAVFHMPGLWRLAFPVHPEENEADVLASTAGCTTRSCLASPSAASGAVKPARACSISTSASAARPIWNSCRRSRSATRRCSRKETRRRAQRPSPSCGASPPTARRRATS